MERLDRRSAPAVGGATGAWWEGGGVGWTWLGGATRVEAVEKLADVRDSGGGGVSSSTSGRSGSTAALSLGDITLPFVLGSETGLPSATMGVEGAERPRMMPSSTSRFLASMTFLRVASVSF